LNLYDGSHNSKSKEAKVREGKFNILLKIRL